MPHSLNSILDTTRAPTLTRTMFPSSSLKVRTCIRMTLEKSVLDQANSFLCRVDTNIGAEAIKPKARSSTRKGRESSTLYRRSSELRLPPHKEAGLASFRIVSKPISLEQFRDAPPGSLQAPFSFVSRLDFFGEEGMIRGDGARLNPFAHSRSFCRELR